MNALLLVDIQNDFVPGGALAVADGDRVVPVANRLMASGRFDLVVATQDWHPADHGSFAANHPGTKVSDMIDLNGLQQILWPVHCVQHSHGSEFVPALRTDRFNHVVHKGTNPEIDSYSGFFDNGRRKATGLDRYLRDNNVDELFVAGLATDYCVLFTVLDARELGYKVKVIHEGIRGVNLKPDDSANAIEQMQAAGAEVISEKDVRPE